MSDTIPSGVRRALLIGVNTYVKRPLDGCVADAELLAKILRERFSFDAANVTLLLNAAATRDAVLAELDQLVDLTAADDVAFIFYAGHGSQSLDKTGSESSRYDSTLNVSDNPRQDILDDEIAERLATLGQTSPHTVMVIDACHSGTIARDAGDANVLNRKERWSPPVERTTLPTPTQRSGTARSADAAPRDTFVLISACHDDEIAQEHAIPGDESVAHGALTFALAQELQRAASGDTWRDLFLRVARSVTSQHATQHPQIDGNADREIFGLRDLPPQPFVQITERASATVVLAAGSLHGVTTGSIWTVYPDGTKDTANASSLGTVEVVVAKGTTSRAKIVSEISPQSITAGARAVAAQGLTFSGALALDNMDPKSRMRGTVTLDFLRRSDDGKWSVAVADETAGMPIYESGERIAFQITSTLDESVFVNLFDFDPRGSVGALTKGWANELAAKGVFRIGADTRKISMKADAVEVTESFKLFASVKQVTLGFLLDLDAAARGTEEVAALNAEDWCTDVKTIRVRPKPPAVA